MEELLNGFRLIRFSRIRLRGDWEIELPEVEIIGNKPPGGDDTGGGGSTGGPPPGGDAGGGPGGPGGPPNPGGGGTTPGGGTGGGNNGSGTGGGTAKPSAQAKAIIKQFNLDNAGIENLNYIIETLLDRCGYEYVYEYLTAVNFIFSNVKYDSNGAMGGYNSATKELTFKDENTITGALPEEYIHLYQDAYYPGGISQYANTGKPNIEFEAKLITDIMCTVDTPLGGCALCGATPSNAPEYVTWLNRITNYGNKIPSYSDLMASYSDCGNKNYWDFMNDFKNDPTRPEYGKPIDPNLLPNALLSLLNSDCYKNN